MEGFRQQASDDHSATIPLKQRTKELALRIIRLYCALPKTTVEQTIGKQLLRSGTSVGAHDREATRSRSDAEFISKLEGGLQELEETMYWLELLVEAEAIHSSRLDDLLGEADELTAILTSCVKNAKGRVRDRPQRARRSPK
ncbi:MAG: four helix bundle protein [Planctomycetaceae bacterium]